MFFLRTYNSQDVSRSRKHFLMCKRFLKMEVQIMMQHHRILELQDVFELTVASYNTKYSGKTHCERNYSMPGSFLFHPKVTVVFGFTDFRL